jgi:hypothetical protein
MLGAEPSLTIIITVFNQQHFVQRAVQSCLIQQIQNLEIIVIDDGSETAIYLPDVQLPAGAQLKLFRQVNGGVASARNFGIEKATGDFIKFLDCDDELLPDCCAAQLASVTVARQQLSIIGYRVQQGGRWVEGVPKFDRFFTAVLQGNVAPLHAFMYRKCDIQAIGGFDETERTRAAMEDYDFHLRLAMSGVIAVTVHQCGVLYHRLPQSRSSDTRKVHQANIRILVSAIDHFLVAGKMALTDSIDSSWRNTDLAEAILTGIVQQAVQSQDYQGFLPVLVKLQQKLSILESSSAYQLQWQAKCRLAATNNVDQQQFWRQILLMLEQTKLPDSRLSQPGYWFRPQAPALAAHFFDGILLAQTLACARKSKGLWLWGPGVWGDYWLSMLSAIQVTPCGFIDSQAKQGDSYQQLPCLQLDDIPSAKLQHIIICSRDSYVSILQVLNSRQLGHLALHYVTL